MNAREIIQDLLQAKLEPQDKEKLEQFWFRDDARVMAIRGTTNRAVSGPVLSYTIEDEKSVVIGDGRESLSDKWEQLRVSGNELTVICDGEIKTFKITRDPKKERWLP